eukprot:scaffold608_cov144-Skeletonema_menzelii.AAC.13
MLYLGAMSDRVTDYGLRAINFNSMGATNRLLNKDSPLASHPKLHPSQHHPAHNRLTTSFLHVRISSQST